jgi:hypothetical protein
MSILQKSTSSSQAGQRVRFRGSLWLDRSRHSRTLNRLFSCPTNDNVCATVEKVKRPPREKFFIPLGARSCAIFGRCLRTEFRHHSCNTAPR